MSIHYPLSANTALAHTRWVGLAHRTGPIERHMLVLIRSVARALESGLFYTTDVHANVIADFGDYLALGDTERGADRVEGGVFGMEIYYARDYLYECNKQASIRQASKELALIKGMHIGSLVFNDFKLTTTCTVAEIGNGSITLRGKRGRNTVEIKADALAIKYALERAFEKGKRKSPNIGSATTAPTADNSAPLDFGLFAATA